MTSGEITVPADINPDKLVAEKIGTLPLVRITGMTIDPTGHTAVVISDTELNQYVRSDQEDWTTTFAHPAIRLVKPKQPQGESVCFGPDGKSLFFSSEGYNQPIWKLPVKGK